MKEQDRGWVSPAIPLGDPQEVYHSPEEDSGLPAQHRGSKMANDVVDLDVGG